MQLFIASNALVLDIVVYHLEVAVLADRICVIALCPKVTAPQFVLNGGMCFEYVPCGDAFDFFDDI